MADNKKKKYKKRKHPNGAPKPAETSAAEKNSSTEERSAEPELRRPQAVKAPRPQDTKPFYLRMIMLAVAVVMILGIVISAAAGSTGGFF